MKINKFCIYFLIILVGVILVIPKVKATELLPSEGFYWDYANSTFYQNGNGQNVPKSTTISSNGGVYGPYALNLYLSPSSSGGSVLDAPIYSYLYIDVCNNLGMGVSRAIITNSTLGTNYLQNGTYSPFIDTGACSVGNTALTHHQIFEIPIGRWNLNEYSGIFEVSSYLQLKNNATYGTSFQINYMYLSDEKLSTSQELMNKLNTINTAITNMQNSINSNNNTNTQNIINNNNTNTQNIINNQNTNAQQAHNDFVNTQNTIKDDSIDNPNSSINTIKNSLASNGVITSLVVLPVTLYQAILNSVNGTCSTFSLGSLFGTNLTIPCINVSNYLGTTLWSSIDVIISGIFVYMISRKMVKVFNQLSSLKEGDILDG